MNIQELSKIARRHDFNQIFKLNSENQLTLLTDLIINDVEYKLGDIMSDDNLHFHKNPENYVYNIASIKIGRILVGTIPIDVNKI